MRRKEWKIHGVDIVEYLNGPKFSSYAAESIVSMTLYLLKDLKWILQVWLISGEHEVCLSLCLKEEFEIDYVEDIMKASLVQIKEHIKRVGLSVNYTGVDKMRATMHATGICSRTVRVRYSFEQEEN